MLELSWGGSVENGEQHTYFVTPRRDYTNFFTPFFVPLRVLRAFVVRS